MRISHDLLSLSNVLILAQASEKALDEKYQYGMSEVGSFGHMCNIQSASRVLGALMKGVTDIEKLADLSHEGWADVALSFDDPVYKKNPDKKKKREELAKTKYKDLPEEEKEKDRVAARHSVP